MRATRAIIHIDNIKHNIEQIRQHTGKAAICAVVKANGYGSSGIIVAKTAQDMGIKDFAVATVSEAVQLRESGIDGRVLLLSPFDKSEFQDIIDYNITPCVSDESDVKNGAAVLANVFLAIDTGMGRVGCAPSEALNTALNIEKAGAKVTGLITHFSVGDSLKDSDKQYTKRQLALFNGAISSLTESHFDRSTLCCTASASSAFLMNGKGDSEFALDMVRAGVILYGLPPSADVESVLKEKGVDLRPVMSVVTKVALTKHCKKGDCLSYGRTFVCDCDTNIAVIPIGYADGILRRYGSFLKVAINGKAYPIAGRICMDMCMVDLGGDTVKAGDDVIVFGDKAKGAIMDASDIAKNCATINYEVTSCISSRVPRVAE